MGKGPTWLLRQIADLIQKQIGRPRAPPPQELSSGPGPPHLGGLILLSYSLSLSLSLGRSKKGRKGKAVGLVPHPAQISSHGFIFFLFFLFFPCLEFLSPATPCVSHTHKKRVWGFRGSVSAHCGFVFAFALAFSVQCPVFGRLPPFQRSRSIPPFFLPALLVPWLARFPNVCSLKNRVFQQLTLRNLTNPTASYNTRRSLDGDGAGREGGATIVRYERWGDSKTDGRTNERGGWHGLSR